MHNLRDQIATNFIWRILERFGAQGVTFVVSVVLARLLEPKVYGEIALVTVFISILQVFVDSGLGNALVQKKDPDNIDFSSVFFFNIVVCIALYVLIFICAPFIARFYKMEHLKPVIRVLGLSIIVSGIKNIQQAYVSKHMLFKKFFFATLGGTIGAGIIGIWMAWCGFGIWALVAQYLFNHAVDAIILWILVKWRPLLAFSWIRLKALLNYGWKLLAASLLATIYNQLSSLIIGKKYTSSDLAFFNKGGFFPAIIASNVSASFDSVLFPTMSARQDNPVEVRRITRKSIQVSTYVLFPTMAGLAVCGKAIITLLLTEKWLPCLPFLYINCFSYSLYSMHTGNLNAIKALGRSDIYLKLEIVKKIIGLTAILVTMSISVRAMGYSIVVTSILGLIINAWPNRKLLGYGYWNQLLDVLPQVTLSLIMSLCVYLVTLFQLRPLLTLLIQIPLGIGIYIFLSIVIKNRNYILLKSMLGSYLMKIRKG